MPARTPPPELGDRVTLAVGLSIWLLCWIASARCVLRGTPYPPITVAPASSPDTYPVVNGFYPWLPAERSGLRLGDRLLRLGEADLRGVGPIDFVMLVPEEAGAADTVPILFERAGTPHESALPLGTLTQTWPSLPSSLVFVLTGVALLVRARPPNRLVRAAALTMLATGIYMGTNVLEPRAAVYPQMFVRTLAATLIGPLAMRTMLEFERNDAPRGLLERFSPWALGLVGPIELAGRLTGLAQADTMVAVASILMLATLLIAGTVLYRRADAVVRRQARWVLFGLYCAMAPSIAAAAAAAVDPALFPLLFYARLASVALPICMLLAIVRYNLFDIDRLISATASYNVVLVLLVATGLAVAPYVAAAATRLPGVPPAVGQAAVALVLAGIVVPLHRRLRPRLERVFFPERYALDRGIEDLLRELSHTDGVEALLAHTGEGLHRLLRPDSCSVFAQVGTAYTPVFAHGRAIPPAFAAEAPLIAVMRTRGGLLALERPSRDSGVDALSPFDRAALETLEAAVVLPIRRADDLVGFVCLGPKRSGDVYTPTDLRLLATIADKLASELLRIAHADILRESRKMQAELRRYVPGAVAEQLARGRPLDAGEREVSVLFVDLRSYTTYAETQPARELFSTVNRFTEAVSRVVRDHGGSVVEFAGDGMMAVFGAPDPLPDKERAAAGACRDICATVAGLAVSGHDGAPARLAVGIGVATGRAFVGNVQAVDHAIWTAIGDTVNLAARLQALSRDLEAAVVVDATTWRRLEAAAQGAYVRHEAVPIRGRRQREDVYAVPLDPAGEAPPEVEPRAVSALRLVTTNAARPRDRPT